MSYRYWVFIAVGLFAGGIVVGLAMPERLGGALSQELAGLQQLAAMLGPFKVTTALFIFLKNVLTLVLSFALSPFFLLMPILALVLNGLLIAVVSVIVIQNASLGVLLSGTLPHGIIEMPALMLGEAAALSFGVMAMGALLSAERRKAFVPGLICNLKYLGLASLLLLPAAFIETYVTPLLLHVP